MANNSQQVQDGNSIFQESEPLSMFRSVHLMLL